MIWLDTNVVVRVIVGTPADQASAAARFVEDNRALVYLSPVVAMEAAHTLRSVYAFSRRSVCADLTAIVEALETAPAQRQRLLSALAMFGDRSVDLPDAWLAAETLALGDSIVTFDRDLRRLGADVVDPMTPRVPPSHK